MKLLKSLITTSLFLLPLSVCSANWQAKVTNILQHGSVVAVTLSPDPGPASCEAGSPYLLTVDDTPASKQRFSMILSALATGNSISGYHDPCLKAIWGKTRPTIVRLNLKSN